MPPILSLGLGKSVQKSALKVSSGYVVHLCGVNSILFHDLFRVLLQVALALIFPLVSHVSHV